MFKKNKTSEPNNAEKAYEYAVFLLSLRLRTEGELDRSLRRRGYSQEISEQVLLRLKQQRYVNDRQFAEVFLENMKSYRLCGYYGIKKKFLEKFLPEDLIEPVLAAGFTRDDELAVAKKLLKKIGYKKQSADESGRRSAARKLAARGFRTDVVADLLW